MPIPQEVAPVEESKITELMQEETAKKADAPQVIAADADLQPFGDFDIGDVFPAQKIAKLLDQRAFKVSWSPWGKLWMCFLMWLL